MHFSKGFQILPGMLQLFSDNIRTSERLEKRLCISLSLIQPMVSVFSHITVVQSLIQFKVCLTLQNSASSDLHYSSLYLPTLPVLIFFSDSTYISSPFFPVGFHILPKLFQLFYLSASRLHSHNNISFSLALFPSRLPSALYHYQFCFDRCLPFCFEVLHYD